MSSLDRRVGLIGAAGLVGLVGGGMFLTSGAEFRRLQDEQKTAAASTSSTGIENPRSKELKRDLIESLGVATAGGVIFLGSAGTLGVGAVSIYINRRRPEPA